MPITETYQMAVKYLFQMDMKNNNIFNSKVLQNIA
jgi:hypothetical protein